MAPDSGIGTGAPTLADLIASLDAIPDRESDGRRPTIYAWRPWTSDSEAALLHGERFIEAVTAPGFTYLLEVDLAKDVIGVWSAWRNGRTPTLAEAVSAVIWYAEHDAYQPNDDTNDTGDVDGHVSFDAVIADLLSALTDLIGLLDAHAERHWAVWLAARRDRIGEGDGNALRQLRAAFGGMGSLNDLMIHPANGHQVSPDDVDGINRRLRELLSRVWANTHALLTELDQP